MAEVAVGALAPTAVRPYPPSWLDRCQDWVRRLPGPTGLFYVGLGAALVLVDAASKWLDGTNSLGTFHPFHTVLALTAAYCLALIHYLDDWAGSALATFRPALAADEETYDDLLYRLTTLPARPALLASLAGAIGGALLLLITPQITFPMLLELYSSPLATVLDLGIFLIVSWVLGAFLYHTAHQLAMVNDIYTRHARISLFQTGPLYAFSWLTTRTAIGLLIIVYAWVVTIPGAWVTPERVALAVCLQAIAVATFAWPLLGIHGLLVEEKAQRKAGLGQRLDETIGALQHAVDTADLAPVTGLKDAITSLVALRDEMDKVPVWPWHPDMLRALVTALFLPVVLWFITRLLERFVSF